MFLTNTWLALNVILTITICVVVCTPNKDSDVADNRQEVQPDRRRHKRQTKLLEQLQPVNDLDIDCGEGSDCSPEEISFRKAYFSIRPSGIDGNDEIDQESEIFKDFPEHGMHKAFGYADFDDGSNVPEDLPPWALTSHGQKRVGLGRVLGGFKFGKLGLRLPRNRDNRIKTKRFRFGRVLGNFKLGKRNYYASAPGSTDFQVWPWTDQGFNDQEDLELSKRPFGRLFGGYKYNLGKLFKGKRAAV